MSTYTPGAMTASDYDRAAQEYLAHLPLEHFMEATPQATQREITVASLALLKHRRGDVRYFNELLVQYFHQGRLRQVVPDNMLVQSDEPERKRTNFAVELEAAPLFLVLEYVSPSNPRKDYQENFERYERELEVPYYVLFYPEKQDLRVFRHDGDGYVRLQPDATGRYAIDELNLRIGLLNHWVRFWHQGDLLELPAELDRRIEEMTEQLRATIEQLNAATRELEMVKAQFHGMTERVRQLLDLQQRGADALRQAVEVKAGQAGRQDLLDLLPNTIDVAQLSQWFLELA